MRKKNTESIGEVLKEFFRDNETLRRKIAEHRVVSGWEKVLGKSIASYTTNIYLKQDILYIHLNSSVLRAELMMSKHKLVDSLNDYAKSKIIKDIIFR